MADLGLIHDTAMDMMTWSPKRKRFYEIYGYDIGPQIDSPMDAMRPTIVGEDLLGRPITEAEANRPTDFQYTQGDPSRSYVFGDMTAPGVGSVPKVKQVITETDDDQPNKKVTTIDYSGTESLPNETGRAKQSIIPTTGYNYEQRVVDGPESPEMGHYTSFAREFGGNLPSEGFQLDRGLQGGMLGDIESMSSEGGYLAESPEDISETFLPVDPLQLHQEAGAGQYIGGVQDIHDQRIEDAVMEDFPSGVLFTDPITGTEVTIGDIAMLVPLANIPSAIRAAGGIAAWVAKNKGLINQAVRSNNQKMERETSRLTGMATRQPARETSRLTGLLARQGERDTSFLTGLPTRQAARDTSRLTGMTATQPARDTSRLTGLLSRQPERDTSFLTGLPNRQAARDTSRLTGLPAIRSARDTSRLTGLPAIRSARDTSRLTGLPTRQTARDTSRLEGFSKGPPRLPPPPPPGGATDFMRMWPSGARNKLNDIRDKLRLGIVTDREQQLVEGVEDTLDTDLITDVDIINTVADNTGGGGDDDNNPNRFWGEFPEDIDAREERYLHALNEMYKKVAILNVIAHLTGTESQAPLFMKLAAEKFKTLEGFRGERRLAQIAKGVYYSQNADGTFTWNPPSSQQDAYNRALRFKASQREAKIISGYEPGEAKKETTSDIRNLNFLKDLQNKGDPMAPLFAKAANLSEDDAGSISVAKAIELVSDDDGTKLDNLIKSLEDSGASKKEIERIRNNIMNIIKEGLSDSAPQQQEAGQAGVTDKQVTGTPVLITTQEEYDALEPGTLFIDSSGDQKIKGQ